MIRSPCGQVDPFREFAVIIPGERGAFPGVPRTVDFSWEDDVKRRVFHFCEQTADYRFPEPPRGAKYKHLGCFEGRLTVHGWLYLCDKDDAADVASYREVLAELARYLNELSRLTGYSVVFYGSRGPTEHRYSKKSLLKPDARPTRYVVERYRGPVRR